MDARYAARKQALLQECQMAPEMFAQVMPRLETFMAPFVESFRRQEPDQHAQTSVSGLLSDVERNNVASIASRFGHDRLPLQRVIGWAPWDDAPLRQELTRQVAAHLGHPDGVVVFDPSGFATSGHESVGVARQWCGRLGTVDHCQEALSLGYVSSQGHTLVDMRLYVPKDWTQDKTRLDKAGVPNAHRGSRSRHQWALEMLSDSGSQRPHRWVSGDEEMGRPSWCRRRRSALGARYLLAVPGNTLLRDLSSPPPAYRGRGRRPTRPWQRLDHWSAARPQGSWKTLEGRDGATGPLVVEISTCPVGARTPQRQEGHRELAVGMRSLDRDHQEMVNIDFSLCNVRRQTPLMALARVAKAAHRLEECLQRSKREAGLADDEVRHWRGWQHHQTLSWIATWFLVRETDRGKTMDDGHHLTSDSPGHCPDCAPRESVRNRIACAA